MASSSQPGPAQPKSVLRGHRAQVHAAAFIRANQRLASGDADGFVVLWDLTIMRARAVWRAHGNAILGLADWGDDRIITHGRDNRLVVWKLGAGDEATMSTVLPLDASSASDGHLQPHIVHTLEINTMNFCSFSACSEEPANNVDSLLVAVPNTLASEAIDVFQLPSRKRLHTIHMSAKGSNNGMVMALALFWRQGRLMLVAGYESGFAYVARMRQGGSLWDVVYKVQAHSQPILSLDTSPDKDYFLTSGADAIIAKHPVPGSPHADANDTGSPVGTVNSKPSTQNQKHPNTAQNPGKSLLSAALASAEAGGSQGRPRDLPPAATIVETQPLKTINTKHSGQQGLCMRSDGRIFATAGWDARMRVYSAKTMAELAVLKWHETGCYAAALAAVGDRSGSGRTNEPSGGHGESRAAQARSPDGGSSTQLTTRPGTGDISVKERRIRYAQQAHWLAAGSKDGKISLWDIY